MSQRGNRRRLLLFFAAIIVPSIALFALSMRIRDQERELADKRLNEDRLRFHADIVRTVLRRLDELLQSEVELTSGDTTNVSVSSAVTLLARVEAERLVLPWEEADMEERLTVIAGSRALRREIQEGERDELIHRDFDSASGHYRRAIADAENPSQRGYAQLLLARVLSKSGRALQAQPLYRALLLYPRSVVDEHGVPLSLYAAHRLAEEDSAAAVDMVDLLESFAADRRKNVPSTVYLLDELARRLAEGASDERVRRRSADVQRVLAVRMRHLEQAISLQSDFERVALSSSKASASGTPETGWILYGPDPWLVNIASKTTEPGSVLVAVDARILLGQVAAELKPSEDRPHRVQFYYRGESAGEVLGPALAGLRATIVTDNRLVSGYWTLQETFLHLVLLLVLGITLFGGHLIWRDMRRDSQVAEVRSQFVSSVSHELKTPLTSIRMFAETLRLRKTSNSLMQEEYLDTIISESERLTRLLNNVLDFSKIEQGTRRYHVVHAPLPEAVRTAARTLQYPLAQQGFTLRVRIDDCFPEVPVDADALQQAILNLVANAMKFSAESREIALSLTRRESEAVIEVVDYGLGIPPEEQGRIFQKFYRIPTPETRHIPGTGLGLTLVEHITRAHGGRVTVRSAPGMGSTFSIHLPLAPS